MDRLFGSSDKFVCIYSSNYDDKHYGHDRLRKFTDYISNKFKNFKLVSYIKNKYPYDKIKPDDRRNNNE